MVEQIVVYPYHGILLRIKRNRQLIYTIIWMNHKGIMPIAEGCMLHDSIYKTFMIYYRGGEQTIDSQESEVGGGESIAIKTAQGNQSCDCGIKYPDCGCGYMKLHN